MLNFEEIIKSSHATLFRLEEWELQNLFECDNLNVDSEDTVLLAVEYWWDGLADICEVLDRVRWSYVSVNALY